MYDTSSQSNISPFFVGSLIILDSIHIKDGTAQGVPLNWTISHVFISSSLYLLSLFSLDERERSVFTR